jgi:hypothetical protein
MRAACTAMGIGSKDCDVQVITHHDGDNAIKQSSLHAVEHHQDLVDNKSQFAIAVECIWK